jgi:hypothetical protein
MLHGRFYALISRGSSFFLNEMVSCCSQKLLDSVPSSTFAQPSLYRCKRNGSGRLGLASRRQCTVGVLAANGYSLGQRNSDDSKRPAYFRIKLRCISVSWIRFFSSAMAYATFASRRRMRRSFRRSVAERPLLRSSM